MTYEDALPLAADQMLLMLSVIY